jgi:hypothetical protein
MLSLKRPAADASQEEEELVGKANAMQNSR